MSDKYKFSDADKVFISKAENYCASAEQCRTSVMEKLLAWGADREKAGQIVDYLVQNEYIDEARYCRIYCESKLHLQKWGRIKINYMLRNKRIDNRIITAALQQLDPDQYTDTLRQLALSKLGSLAEPDPHKRRSKLVAFLASHGFEQSEIQEVINPLLDKEA
ncbi:MAG: RecX family transcriptional regulator [Bacteroidales bacterium]|nr:RecX family transcriptional regulator [Bacteroidales bacterium]